MNGHEGDRMEISGRGDGGERWEDVSRKRIVERMPDSSREEGGSRDDFGSVNSRGTGWCSLCGAAPCQAV